MTAFVAGGSGTIGVPLVRALVAAGYRVFATTRSADKQAMIRGLGAMPVVVDALDAAALERAVRAAAPTHVIHQLTALPRTGVRRASDPTNRLREEGRRLCKRPSPRAPPPHRRIVPLLGAAADERHRTGAGGAATVRSMGPFATPRIGGRSDRASIRPVLRAEQPVHRGDDRSCGDGDCPWCAATRAAAAVHLATRWPPVAALERGSSGSAYDIVDDHPTSFSEIVAEMAHVGGAPRPFTVPAWLPRLMSPYMARMLMTELPLSNEKARRDLGWAPIFQSYREGLRQTIDRAA
jgi:nucleoside-diphosphate-sugar epimerase